MQGLLYASSISNLVKQTIDLHLMLNSPLSKKVVRPLTKLIELLKVRARSEPLTDACVERAADGCERRKGELLTLDA